MTTKGSSFPRTWLMAVASLALFQLATAASAMCVYNSTESPQLQVELACGWFCENEWYIDPGGSNCRPGDGGLVSVYGGVPTYGYVQDVEIVDVDDHGYVVIYSDYNGDPTYYGVCSYHQDHTLSDCTNMIPPNGGF